MDSGFDKYPPGFVLFAASYRDEKTVDKAREYCKRWSLTSKDVKIKIIYDAAGEKEMVTVEKK